jgi:hypothetical protein
MPMGTKRLSETNGERHIPQPATFRSGNVPLPFRSLDAKLTLLQVSIPPL